MLRPEISDNIYRQYASPNYQGNGRMLQNYQGRQYKKPEDSNLRSNPWYIPDSQLRHKSPEVNNRKIFDDRKHPASAVRGSIGTIQAPIRPALRTSNLKRPESKERAKLLGDQRFSELTSDRRLDNHLTFGKQVDINAIRARSSLDSRINIESILKEEKKEGKKGDHINLINNYIQPKENLRKQDYQTDERRTPIWEPSLTMNPSKGLDRNRARSYARKIQDPYQNFSAERVRAPYPISYGSPYANYSSERQRAPVADLRTSEKTGETAASPQTSKSPNREAIYSSPNGSTQKQDRQKSKKKKIVDYEVTKSTTASKGIVSAFGICSTEGLVRNYNEDRVSVRLNVSNQNTGSKKCSYFSVFDGHGGKACAEYLCEGLHNKIINNELFPQNIPKAIKTGVLEAEEEFMKTTTDAEGIVERSGACALLAVFVDDECFLGNVGDCRAILSVQEGHKMSILTQDHKPDLDTEKSRIEKAGGSVYQSSNQDGTILGPARVIPGKLSVCRTVGDVHAKDPRFGGNPNVVIAQPDIYKLKIASTDDFILLGSIVESIII